MLALALIVCGLLALAASSAIAAYRFAGSRAWSDEYDEDGIGLVVELTLLVLVLLVAIAMSFVMNDAFRRLYLEDGWSTYGYVAVTAGCTLIVLWYTLVFAPRKLAEKHAVERAQIFRACRLPYLAYTPYSVILLVGLALPVFAALSVSLYNDVSGMIDARHDLSRNGDLVATVVDRESASAEEHVAIYGLEYREAVDIVRSAVRRYLWVVGVFVFFLMIVVNTRITRAYDQVSQDIFKWFMWGLLVVGMAICLVGLTQHRAMRELAIKTDQRLVESASADENLGLVVTAKEALLEVREESAAKVLRGGFIAVLSLVFVSNASQLLIARFTNRSAVDVIFPSHVARFLHGFLWKAEDSARP